MIAVQLTVRWPPLFTPGLAELLGLSQISYDQARRASHHVEGGIFERPVEIGGPDRAAKTLFHQKRESEVSKRWLAFLDLPLDIRAPVAGRRIRNFKICGVFVFGIL